MNDDHAVLILDAPLFRGIEAEGPFKGERVLFVADPKLELKNIAVYLKSVDAVYLGSARLQPINFDLAQDLADSSNVRICFEIADLMSAVQAMELLHRYPERSHHLVFTELMKKPNGAVVADWPGAFYHYQLAMSKGLCTSLKTDDGFTVTLQHGDKVFANQINADYAEDERVSPVY